MGSPLRHTSALVSGIGDGTRTRGTPFTGGEPRRLPPRSQTFGDRKWGVFTRLETRTKESNRRAREKILLPVLLSY